MWVVACTVGDGKQWGFVTSDANPKAAESESDVFVSSAAHSPLALAL